MINVDAVRIRLLDWLSTEHGDHPGQASSLSEFAQMCGVSEDLVRRAVVEANQHGLVLHHQSLGGPGTAQITVDGLKDVEERQARRQNVGQRRVACRTPLLQWLYDRWQENGDTGVQLFNFFWTHGRSSKASYSPRTMWL